MDEPAEDAKADTDASDVGCDEHYCIEVAFEFVHGFGFSGWFVGQRYNGFSFCDLLRQIFFIFFYGPIPQFPIIPNFRHK